MHFGDDIKFGNVSGSNIAIKARDIRQVINNAPITTDQDKDILNQLVEKLETALKTAPPAKGGDVEAILVMLKQLVDEASKQQPNKTLLSISAEGLKKAAESLKDIVPTVLTISAQIVTHILKTTGM